MNRWDSNAIEYTDVEALRTALVGRSIVSTESVGEEYERTLTFVLDDGTRLQAHAAHGGCACSNGCFTVEPGNVIRGTIMNVEVEEALKDWDYTNRTEVAKPVEPGSISDGEATISVFVYGDLGKQLLVSSEGGDNGYYGWGFWLNVEKPVGA